MCGRRLVRLLTADSGQICTHIVPGDHSGSPDCQDEAVECLGELRWSDLTHSLAYERPGWSTSVVLLTHDERARTCQLVIQHPYAGGALACSRGGL